jgi:hypothetical protein
LDVKVATLGMLRVGPYTWGVVGSAVDTGVYGLIKTGIQTFYATAFFLSDIQGVVFAYYGGLMGRLKSWNYWLWSSISGECLFTRLTVGKGIRCILS